ncbi:MAG: phosphatase PAP2 family protein [Planctomycetes bacterium]|nr:phosphatase PAP2 family protein [Planctomycetota bacterium]
MILPEVEPIAWPRIRFVLTAYAIASVLAFIVYAAYPVRMERPDYTGEGFGMGLMRDVIGVDDPANCFPSSHTLFAVLGPILVSWGRAPRWLAVVAWILGVSICATTITVGQHYFVDVAGGIVVAAIGFLVARATVKV